MYLNLSAIFAVLVLVALATAFYAKSKGRNPYLWGFLALLPFLNAPAILVLFFLGPVSEARE